MAKNLVIVESPAKAKTIEGYLGKDFVVKSSFGHVRDLAKKGTAIDIENNFTSQLAKLIRMETGYDVHHKINKYSGEPFNFEELLNQVESVMNGKVAPKIPELAGTK